jgi:hypothetical protein
MFFNGESKVQREIDTKKVLFFDRNRCGSAKKEG